MADTDLNIILKAEDRASREIKNVGGALAGLGDIAGGILKTGALAGAVGIGALTVGLGASIKAAMDAEAVQADLLAVLKSTGGAAGVTADMANELASALQNVTRFEDDAIVKGEAMLLTFTNVGKDIFPQVTETMLDMAQKFHTGPEQAAIQLGKALNDPITGLTALRRVGVAFTDEQEKQIKALVESGQLMEAQKIILRELQTEFGGVARAAGDTLAGKLDILHNKIGDLMETIGGLFIPLLSDAASALIGFLSNPAIQAGIQTMLGGFLDLVRGIAKGIGDAVGWVVKFKKEFDFQRQMGKSPLGALEAAIRNFAPPELRIPITHIFDGIKTVLDWLDKTALPAVRKFRDDVVGVFAAPEIQSAVTTFLNHFGPGLDTLADKVKNFIENMKQQGVGQALGDVFKGFDFEGAMKKSFLVPQGRSGLAEALEELLGVEDLQSALQGFADSLRDDVDWQSIVAALGDGLGAALSGVGSLLNTLFDAIGQVDWGAFAQSVGDQIAAAFAGGGGSAAAAGGAGTFVDKIGQAIAAQFATIDWGAVLAEGGDIAQRIGDGLGAVLAGSMVIQDKIGQWFITQLTNVAGQIAEAMLQMVTTALSPLEQYIRNQFSGAVLAFKGVWDSLNRAFAATQEVIKKIFAELESAAQTFGAVTAAVLTFIEQAIKPLAEAIAGILVKIHELIAALASLAGKLANFALGPFQPGSPSPFELALIGINDQLRLMNALLPGGIGIPLNPALEALAAAGRSAALSYPRRDFLAPPRGVASDNHGAIQFYGSVQFNVPNMATWRQLDEMIRARAAH